MHPISRTLSRNFCVALVAAMCVSALAEPAKSRSFAPTASGWDSCIESAGETSGARKAEDDGGRLGLHVPLILLSWNCGVAGEAPRQGTSSLSADRINAANSPSWGNLRYWLGKESDVFWARLEKDYPGYQIVSACDGSFKRPAQSDVALAAVSMSDKKAVYFLAFHDRSNISFAELSRFDIRVRDGQARGNVEVACRSWTEILRINRDYAGGSPDSGRYSNLKPATKLDVACIVPTGGDIEYLCYQYAPQKRRFREIGWWRNE